MALFRRRKPKEEEVKEIKEIVEGKKIDEEILEKPEEVKEETPEEVPKEIKEPIEEMSEEELVTEKPEEVKPSFAPLFIKLDRYKSVLDTINEIKSIIISTKNSLDVQKQIEELRDENRKLLEATISQIDKKLTSLDSEFLRPKGYEEEPPITEYKTESLQIVVSDLKKQIENLKSELKTIS